MCENEQKNHQFEVFIDNYSPRRCLYRIVTKSSENVKKNTGKSFFLFQYCLFCIFLLNGN